MGHPLRAAELLLILAGFDWTPISEVYLRGR